MPLSQQSAASGWITIQRVSAFQLGFGTPFLSVPFAISVNDQIRFEFALKGPGGIGMSLSIFGGQIAFSDGATASASALLKGLLTFEAASQSAVGDIIFGDPTGVPGPAVPQASGNLTVAALVPGNYQLDVVQFVVDTLSMSGFIQRLSGP
jgi:hypothetical protein